MQLGVHRYRDSAKMPDCIKQSQIIRGVGHVDCHAIPRPNTTGTKPRGSTCRPVPKLIIACHGIHPKVKRIFTLKFACGAHQPSCKIQLYFPRISKALYSINSTKGAGNQLKTDIDFHRVMKKRPQDHTKRKILPDKMEQNTENDQNS